MTQEQDGVSAEPTGLSSLRDGAASVSALRASIPDAGEFRREARYYTIKRKHLTADQEHQLRAFLADASIETVDCVVVESDWPEYEPVWSMLEARCT